MSKFIQEESDLLAVMPNIQSVGEGERQLLERISAFCEDSEKFLTEKIISPEFIEKIEDQSRIFNAAKGYVANDALLRALASLNLVLTPTGLATTGTENLTPTSAARTADLRKQLTDARDRASDELIELLAAEMDGWADCDCGRTILSSVFFRCRDAGVLGITENRYESVQAALPSLLSAQAVLARDWISAELMEGVIRTVARVPGSDQKCPIARRWLFRMVQDAVADIHLGKGVNAAKMLMVCDRIRKAPTAYPEWVGSETSKLFEAPRFENKKNSHGYFF